MANDAIVLPLSPAQPAGAQRTAQLVRSIAAVRRPLAAMFDQALVSSASFAAVVLIGRVAGERQLGLYSLAVTLAVLAAGIQESLVLVPYTVFAARAGEERRRQLATNTLIQAVVTGLGLAAVLAIAAAVGLAWAWPQWPGVLAALAIVVPATLLREFARRFVFAQLRLDRALMIDGAVTVAQVALIAWLAVAGRLSAVTGLAAWGGTCGMVGAVWLWRTRNQFVLGHGRLRRDWQQSWSLGSWLLAGHVTGISQAYALHWLLAVLLAVDATGDFAAMSTLVALANPVVIGLGNYLMPATARVFAASGASGVWRLARRATLWLAAALAGFCLLAFVAGEHALTLLFGARFAGHAGAIALLALATSAAALGVAAEHALRSMDRPRGVFVANLLALVTTLGVAFWLVPTLQLAGAAGSLLIGNLVGCLARWCAFARILDFRFWILDLAQPAWKSKIQNPKSKIATAYSLTRFVGLALLSASIVLNYATFRAVDPYAVTLDWQAAARIALCGACAVYALFNLPAALRRVTRFPMAWMLVFIGWAWLTLPAAISPTYAAAACATLTASTLFTAALVSRASGEAIVKTIVATIALLVVGCWIAQFVRPDIVNVEELFPDMEPANWRLGGLMHPNGLGAHCALGIGLLCVGRSAWSWGRWPVLFLAAVFAVTLVATGSRTAGAMVVAALAFLSFRRRPVLLLPAIAAIAVALFTGEMVGAEWSRWLTNSVSRRGTMEEIATLTGRTDLWAIAWDHIARSPLWGWGYGCSRYIFLELASFPAQHPHNMFLDTLVETGITGGLIELAMVFALARRMLTRPSAFPDMILLLVAVMGTAEVPIFNPVPEVFTLSWMLALGWQREGSAPRPDAASTTIQNPKSKIQNALGVA